MLSDHEDDEGPLGAQEDFNEEGNASPDDPGELLGASDVDSIWELLEISLSKLTAWIYIDNQATRTTYSAQTEEGNANDDQVRGFTSKTARGVGVGVGGLKTTGLDGDTSPHASQSENQVDPSIMEAVVAHALDWDRMDTDSSQLETPPAWFHIDNQATRTTEANPSHHYEKSQAYGSTSRTVRGKGVGGLETTRLGSNTPPHTYQPESQLDPSMMEASIAHFLDWNQMDTYSSQLESPPTWITIDNQATRTTDLTQTEGGNANDEYESNRMMESSSDESAMERSDASEAPDRFITDSSDDDSLTRFDSYSSRALNNTRADQPGVQVAGDEVTNCTLQRPSNRPTRYECGCGLPLGHAGLCPFNSTEEARLEVLKGCVAQPVPFVSDADVHRLIESQAAGKAAHQEQDGGYKCGMCGRVTRPHPCPFKRCPVCGRRRGDHNNNTFCQDKSKERRKK